jgi:lysophospholipase
MKSVELLLRSGALVHLRDNLGHTALYFVSYYIVYKMVLNCYSWLYAKAARQGQEAIVDVLVQVGAALGGTDQLFADNIVKDATRTGNQRSLRIWLKAGWGSGSEI